MKQVSDFYEELVAKKLVRSIHRYNLRKFCRSFPLPPCGVSFLWAEDLNWNELQCLNEELRSHYFWFRGGESFPRVYWDRVLFGEERRTEFIYLAVKPDHHHRSRAFFQHIFHGHLKTFGEKNFDPSCETTHLSQVRPYLINALMLDLIRFASNRDSLGHLCDFYLALFLATFLTKPGHTKTEIFHSFKLAFPEYRADLARVTVNTDLFERLDDTLHLLDQLKKIQK